jgi:rhombotail lipoprotein
MLTRTKLTFARVSGVALVVAVSCLLTGCVFPWGQARRHEANSIVSFLYPDKAQPYIRPSIPTLHLPLRVGIAFVPSSTHGAPHVMPSSHGTFSEAQKTLLLKRVAEQFKTLPFVDSIQIVPTTYLRPGGGFDNLDQLRALMGIDVVALIAYDQAQNSNETEWSLAYWTIVGAYIVPAQKNDTHTLMEAVVYDIESRSLLFRAPGTSAVKGNSTLYRNRLELQEDARRGLEEASQSMTLNLAAELETFKVRAKEEPETVKIVHKRGYVGGGSVDFATLAIFAVLAGGCWLVRRSR